MLIFLLYCLVIAFGTLGIFVICGAVISLCNTAFRRLGGGFLARWLSILGTPIHELGHLVMCLIFAHRVEGVCLWKSGKRDGVYGYVDHTYNRKNPYHVLGNLFIGVGPILSGFFVVMLTLRLVFPSAYFEYMDLSSLSLFGLLGGGFGVLGDIFSAFFDADIHIAFEILGLIFITSVCLHMTLSKSDIRSSLKAVPLYLLLVLIVATVTFIVGVQDVVYWAVVSFFQMSFGLFMIIILFELALVVLGLAIWGIKKILRLG